MIANQIASRCCRVSTGYHKWRSWALKVMGLFKFLMWGWVMRRNKLYKAISTFTGGTYNLSVGDECVRNGRRELPVAIPENETQTKTAPATGEPSSSHAPVIEPDTQAQSTQIDAPAQTTQTPAQPESTDISIASVDDLKKIGADPAYPPDGTYILTNDIDGKQPDGTERNPCAHRLC